jgi:hypothetical protein
MLKRALSVIAGACLLAGCVSVPEPPYVAPTAFDYAHVWGGEAPEPFHSQGLALRASGSVLIVRWPLEKVERACGGSRDDAGWFQSACTIFGVSTGRPFIVIASEITDLVALRNIEIHEFAHVAGWPYEHPGMVKPVGHLDNCLRVMRATGLTISQIAGLCNLVNGSPLRTADERARWAAMR